MVLDFSSRQLKNKPISHFSFLEIILDFENSLEFQKYSKFFIFFSKIYNFNPLTIKKNPSNCDIYPILSELESHHLQKNDLDYNSNLYKNKLGYISKILIGFGLKDEPFVNLVFLSQKKCTCSP